MPEQTLTHQEYKRCTQLVYDMAGINIKDGKEKFLQSRLGRILRHGGHKSFKEYLDYVATDKTGHAIVEMLDALTTNLTFFFRENKHFDYITKVMIPHFKDHAQTSKNKKIRFWSAGCSTGEEPYSIAITLLEALKNINSWDLKILATDLSTKVLEKAKRGVYDPDELKKMPKNLQHVYFDTIIEEKEEVVRVHDNIKKLITFRRFNLMSPFPFDSYDCIFCRNVMIYFDHQTQEELIGKFYNSLKPGGYLFTGHSESLTKMNHQFKYIQPTIYHRPLNS